MNTSFYQLTPEKVLTAVERLGEPTTGLCYALNSLENRVYEVERDDRSRVIAKFYRPGRWSRECILDEHRLLFAMQELEIPVCAPLLLPDGSSLQTTEDGMFVALFPKVGGRSPDELNFEEYEQLGRLLGRIHNVSSSLSLRARPVLSPESYGRQSLTQLERFLPPGLASRYVDAATRFIGVAEQLWVGQEHFVVHADCHRGNLLRGRSGFFFLDFDDAASAPPVQDFWLLLPARAKDCPQELAAMIEGYETFRRFPMGSVRLIEALRGLRYLRYAGWVASRWEDPSFPRAFPQFGTESYWQNQLQDLYEQLAQLDEQTFWS